jgi:hypothetical protein
VCDELIETAEPDAEGRIAAEAGDAATQRDEVRGAALQS